MRSTQSTIGAPNFSRLAVRKTGHRGQFAIFFLILSLVATTPGVCENRLAFVVGVNKYDKLPEYRRLTRSVDDAEDFSNELRHLSFNVTTGNDLSRPDFNSKWQTFLEQITKDDTVIVFLSGHGVEIEGHNFFLPSDVPYIQFGRQEQLKRESLSIDELLMDLHARAPKVTILILDACRENPMIPPEFKTTAEPGGLAKTEAPEGTFIMYSAAANETALDRLSGDDPVRNSVYMRILLPLMKTPSLPLPDLAQELRRQVRELALRVGHVQRPAYYDSLVGRFCLTGCDEKALGPTVGLAIPNDPARAWSWFKDTTSDEALLAYIDKFRYTEFSNLAAKRLDLIQRKTTTLHIISIGISDYADATLRLRYASADARVIAETIKDRMGPSYASVRVDTLVDGQATKSNIMDAFDTVRSSANPNDTIIVFLSGHAVDIGGQPYFLPVDAILSRPYRLVGTLVSLTDIQQSLATTLGRRLLFLDTAGIPLSETFNTAVIQNARADQITMLGAASPGQPALESESLRHGLFTVALLKAFSGEAADYAHKGEFSIQDLGLYVKREVVELSSGEQQPFFFTDEPNAILGGDGR